MKTIPLKDGLFTTVDDADFELASSYKWRAEKHGRGYRVCRRNCHTINGDWRVKTAFLHRFLLKCKKGEMVDHIDGDPLNNQRANLRFCTHAQNVRNQPKKINSQFKYKGVSKPTKNRWKAEISIDKKRFHIGLYDNEKEAALAYNVAASFAFGEFARLNVV